MCSCYCIFHTDVAVLSKVYGCDGSITVATFFFKKIDKYLVIMVSKLFLAVKKL